MAVDKDDERGAATTSDDELLLCSPPRDRFFRRKAFARFSTTSVIAHAHRNVSSSGGKIDHAGNLIFASDARFTYSAKEW
jgi:hypothetical protein